jgi:hypothetical protein
MIDPSQLTLDVLILALIIYLLRGYLFLPVAWLFGHLVKLLIRFSGKGGL